MLNKPLIDKDQIRTLYSQGHSCREIERITGVSNSYVNKICKDLSRSRLDAVRLACDKQPTSFGWRACRARARKIMKQHLGRALSSDEHVHHKDRDYTNNSLDNLQILDPSTHAKLHHPKNPVVRHKRRDRKRYMQQYYNVTRKATLRCDWCGQNFVGDMYNKGCCSKSCGVSLWWSKRKKETKC